MPPPRKSTNWYEDEMLRKISEVNVKVDQSLKQGSENGEGIRLLRKELGVDGEHGRIPQIERSMATMEIRIDTLQKCVDVLQGGSHFANGVKWVLTFILSVATSSGAVFVYDVLKAHGH